MFLLVFVCIQLCRSSPWASAEILLEGAGAHPKKVPHREKVPKTEESSRKAPIQRKIPSEGEKHSRKARQEKKTPQGEIIGPAP